LEPDPDPERATDDVAVFAPGVPDRGLVGGGGAPDLVRHVQEVDPLALVGGELLPPDAGVEVDRRPLARVRHGRPGARTVRRPAAVPRREVLAPDDLVEGHPELRDDRVQRAHRRPRLPALELGDQARRKPEPPRELALADAGLDAFLAEAFADPVER